ncbi:N-acetylmuramoyl-L-alanine amidase [Agriterribacter sp.]|uniref:N-acetylmuramoyl-L-alanine amidase n=1 Tax=Agriterribacter sp. TaxID=2821509 RepID=UPI002C151DC8|nr:N-acetylmuramoyl-L-alanine amidase [Agriterribacter sp.]HRO45958.1 N-acetylmuramoyl-L-alanine amidase [Agriterribacter sp.]HRQ19313.1 N-acetylmuramoyl-L-alanine amidase [Agriterribacter sp.]
MLAIAYYILKVIICSGILYGYYRLALHNKLFHRWNRFYLLSAVVVSLSFPLITINIWHAPAEDDSQVIKLLNIVTTGDEYVHEVSRSGSFHLSGEQVAIMVYMVVSLALIVILFHALVKLSRLARNNPLQKIQHINVIQTEAKGTPFSFFRYIFWNKNIDMHADAGKKIFTHEMVHVTEKHSADKLFMHIVLIFFWCNPFFWLIRREMNMIHEFIADSKAIDDKDTAAFAAMILHAAYPQQAFGLTSSFFSSSIKRRLHMLTKMQNPSMNYISRLLALPLLTFIFVAFTVKTKQLLPNQNGIQIVQLETPVTVVIDAGHGGDDEGAMSSEGIREKDITLSLSRKIKALNSNKSVKIILTRDNDITQPVRDKVDFAVLQKPDLFISLHVAQVDPNGGDKTKSGFEIYLSKNQTGYTKQAQLFGSLVAGEIEKNYGVAPEIKQRTGKGIWVLDAPVINYPALLIECGYLSNPNDIAFITDEKKQEKIARDILNAIERFAKAKEDGTIAVQTEPQPSLNAHSPRQESNANSANSSIAVKKDLKTAIDTLPANIKSVDITKDNQVIIIYKNNTAEKITKAEAIKRGIVPVAKAGIELRSSNFRTMDSVLYFLDGIEFSKSGLEKINPNDIESIHVIKDKSAVDKYGERAINGVIEITLKNVNNASIVQKGDKTFQIVEKAPAFPGGEAAWAKYISASINKVIDSLQEENKPGTCVVQFIVDTEGNLSEVKPLTMEGTFFAKTVTDAIKNGPKWIPAVQNGHKIKAYHKQPVTFQIQEE